MNIIDLPAPHGYLVWSGKQKAIPTIEPIKNLDSSRKLIIQDGEAFGYVILDDQPVQIKVKDFDSDTYQKEHRVTPRERRQWWGDVDTFYLYRIKETDWFDKSKIYEDGNIIEVRLSKEQKDVLERAKDLPNKIILEENAVLSQGIDTFSSIIDCKELEATLKATYENNITLDTEDNIKHNSESIPLYSLALVRNHKVKKVKKSQKQERDTMPFAIRKRDDEWCVVKLDDDEEEEIETMGCHETEDEAEAHLTALNINVSAEEDKEFSLDKYPSVVRRQFDSKFGLEMGAFPLEVFSNDELPSVSGFIIAEMEDKLWRVDFATNGEVVAFNDVNEWKEVQAAYIPKGYTSVASYEKKEDPPMLIDTQTSGFMHQLKTLFKAMGAFIKFADKPQENLNSGELLLKTDYGITQKEVNGELWHFTWSTNAFEDREKEIFSTKSLEDYVSQNEKREDKGFFNLWHINEEDGNFNSDFAKKEWQGVIGRFLVEAGPYLDNDKGQAAKEFFKEHSEGHPELAPEGWGCSPEFRYLPEERATGVYETIWITRTSTLPKMAAANIWTDANQLRKKEMALSEDQMKAAIEVFGGEDKVRDLIAEAEQKTQELENAGVAHKGDTDTDKPREVEIDIEQLAAEINKQFQLDLDPLIKGVETNNQQIQALAQRIEALEGKQAVDDKASTTRYTLSLRASGNDETVVTEDDTLSKMRPQEQKVKPNEITPLEFFGQAR